MAEQTDRTGLYLMIIGILLLVMRVSQIVEQKLNFISAQIIETCR